MESKNSYLPRVIDKQLADWLKAFGAVCVEGPKWCGKTWTSLQQAKSAIMIGDPEGNFQNRELASISPSLALEGARPRLIDEWQEVPQLWDAVRFIVDKTSEKGQFILTGSATPPQKGVLHSGAGRIARLRMRPMSLYESGESKGQVSLLSLFENQQTETKVAPLEIRAIADLCVRGGWPGALGLPADLAGLIPKSYINAVLEKDIYAVTDSNINAKKVHLLMKSLARNESTTVSQKILQKDISDIDGETIDKNTIASYLDILARLFLIDNQEPFAPSFRSWVRIKQAEKRHLADPSLAVALLGMSAQGLIKDLGTFGFIFEALAERDLRIYAEALSGKLYHYQDYDDREIDAVVELSDGRWAAFEIKLGFNKVDEAAKNLKEIYRKLEIKAAQQGHEVRLPEFMAVICGTAQAACRRPDGIWILPLHSLKP